MRALRKRGFAIQAFGHGWSPGELSTEEMVEISSVRLSAATESGDRTRPRPTPWRCAASTSISTRRPYQQAVLEGGLDFRYAIQARRLQAMARQAC